IHSSPKCENCTVKRTTSLLDWAQGSENQDVSLVLPLCSRLTLCSTVKSCSSWTAWTRTVCLWTSDVRSSLRSHRDQRSARCWSTSSEETASSRPLWITSRPTAANQIPERLVLTEVRGFVTEPQKEHFFRTRFSDTEQCQTVLSHIRSSRCLHTMCQIPVFCWITATVLEHMLRRAQSGPLPQTLTDLYAHFLLVQTQRNRKYGAESRDPELSTADCDVLLKLSRLAFEQLHKGNIMFYQEELQQVGLDLDQASVCSGLCSEIFKQERVIFNKQTYCFKPQSLQEFLAAVYIHHCLNNNDTQVLLSLLGPKRDKECDLSLPEVLRETLDKHHSDLDLFVRFLHGLSLKSGALEPLLGLNKTDQKTIQRVTDNLKTVIRSPASPAKRVSALQCLSEMKEPSVQQMVLDLLESGERLSEIQCSALASVLQMSEQVLEELDFRKFRVSFEGKRRLIFAVNNCRKAVFTFCEVSETKCELLAAALKSDNSLLKELDLSHNYTLDDSGVKVLCEGLQSPHCRLDTLSLSSCSLSVKSCGFLVEALMSNPVHLKTLDLSFNSITDSGVSELCRFLQSPHCQLHTLRLNSCGLSSEEGCSALASALESGSSLRELDLSHNDLQESVKALSRGLKSPDCRLEILRSLLHVTAARSPTQVTLECRVTAARSPTQVTLECRVTAARSPTQVTLECQVTAARSPTQVTLECQVTAARSPTQVTLECQVTAARSPTQVTLECQVTAARSPTQVTLECQVTAARSPAQVTLECQVTAARSPTQVTLECQVTAARSPTQVTLECQVTAARSPTQVTLECQVTAARSPTQVTLECRVTAARSPTQVTLECRVTAARSPTQVTLECRVTAARSPTQVTLECRVTAARSPTQVTLECRVTAARSPTQVTLECQVTAARSPTQVTLECRVTAARSPTQVTLECRVTAARSPTQVTLECQVTAARSRTQVTLECQVTAARSPAQVTLECQSSCSALASTLKSNPKSALKELDLDYNYLDTDPDLTKLLQDPDSSLKTLRFRCPGSGAFRCSSTGLVFVMSKEAELQYRIIQWDEALLESSSRTPAGPLYDIECPEQALFELHLPHCEQNMNPKTKRRKLNVLLLPINVSVDEEAEFFLNYGPNYHPTFEVRLTAENELINITIRDKDQTQVWLHEVDLSGECRGNVQAGTGRSTETGADTGAVTEGEKVLFLQMILYFQKNILVKNTF
ncbi:hypothetical protein WMY93_033454, partial [Mugilogobius chulae]